LTILLTVIYILFVLALSLSTIRSTFSISYTHTVHALWPRCTVWYPYYLYHF